MSCGNVPDGEGTAEQEEVLMPRRRQVRRVDKSLCQRCQVAKSLYVIRNMTFCKACYERTLYGRFAKLLHPPLKFDPTSGKSNKALIANLRPHRQAGDALIALSTGAGSTAMLDLLLSRGYVGKGDGAVADKTKGEKEAIWGKGWVIYVEFAGVLDGVEDRMGEVESWVEGRESGLGWVGLRAEDVFDAGLKTRLRRIGGYDSHNDHEGIESAMLSVDLKKPDLPLFDRPSASSSDATPLSLLQSLLASLPAPSRPSLLSTILNSLLAVAAETLPNISHLLLGETSTRQAQRVISGTALGRGWSLPLEMSSARSDNGLTTLRPMKDVSVREAAVYCQFKKLSTFTRNERRWELAGPAGKRDARGKGGVTSLEMLTEQFIASLSVTHPSTVSTINRTGDKLVFAGEGADSPLCPVCQLPVDPSALEWKSRTALTSLPSKTMSDLSTSSERHDSLASSLCYACLTTFTPSTVVSRSQIAASDPAPLPIWIGERLQSRRRGLVDRDDIKEFLIDSQSGE